LLEHGYRVRAEVRVDDDRDDNLRARGAGVVGGPKPTSEVWKRLVPSEKRQTDELYLSAKIDQWYVITDQSGVVVINVSTLEEAKALMGAVPLEQAPD
jgi:hypothetical protein